MPALYPMRLCRTVKSCSYKETQRKCLEELYMQMGRAGEEVFFFIHAHCVGSSRGVNSTLIRTLSSSGVQTVVLQMSLKKENSICKSEKLRAHNTQVLHPLSNRTEAPLTHHFLSSTDTGFPWLELVFVKAFWAKINTT